MINIINNWFVAILFTISMVHTSIHAHRNIFWIIFCFQRKKKINSHSWQPENRESENRNLFYFSHCDQRIISISFSFVTFVFFYCVGFSRETVFYSFILFLYTIVKLFSLHVNHNLDFHITNVIFFSILSVTEIVVFSFYYSNSY